MFDVSVDQYIFPTKKNIKSTLRRQVDTMLDSLTEKELSIVDATIKGLYNTKSQTED